MDDDIIIPDIFVELAREAEEQFTTNEVKVLNWKEYITFICFNLTHRGPHIPC